MRSSSPSATAEAVAAGAVRKAAGAGADPSPDLPTPEDLHRRLRALAETHGGPLGRLIGADRLLGLSGLCDLLALYAAYREGPPRPIEPALLEALGIDWEILEGRAQDIPATGPLLVVANHPTGAAEALILASLIDARRSDRRVLGNAWVGFVPELGARQIRIDPVGRRGNAGPMVVACRHLRQGGCLMTFPAGTVAHFQWRRGRVAEAPWHPSVAEMARLARAPVLPVRIEARPSRLWRIASPFSRLARTALLPRELLAQRGRRFGLRLGPCLEGRDQIAALFASY